MLLNKFLQVSNTRYINIKTITEINIKNNTCTIYLARNIIVPVPVPDSGPSTSPCIDQDKITIDAESKFYDIVKDFLQRN